jgi:hypothetical protein
VGTLSPSLRVAVDGEGAWPDLARKPNKVMKLGDSAMAIAALAGGMQSGRASVMFRIDLPDGRTVVIETSLRTLHAAVTAIVARHGEPFMQHPLSEREHKIGLALAAVTAQLADAKQRLGEPVRLELEEADELWDREQRLRAALSLARSMILSGEPMSEEAGKTIDDALSGRKPA